MTPAEAAVVLALAAAFDGRDVTSKAAALAWAEVLPDVTLEQGKAAVLTWYATERRWIMPADVRAYVDRRAREALAARPLPVPDADPDDAIAYRDSLRAERDRIINPPAAREITR